DFSSFDSRTRTVNFKCNNLSVCCSKNEKCGKIYWEDRILSNPEKIKIKLSFRCLIISSLDACTVFVGETPAQLEFSKTPKELEFKHEDSTLIFSNELKNSGEKPEVNEITVSISARRILGEEKILQYSGEQKIGSLYPNTSQIFNYEIPAEKINIDGIYEIELTASALNSGEDKKTIQLKVKNSPNSNCEVNLTKDSLPELVEGKCVKKIYCNNCTLAGECRNLWEEKLDTSLEIVDPEFTYQPLLQTACE
ncbi:MAG: hypothetical protein Q7K42_01315, partial [Candidatus Diapherotrites archaeon]|nr:hypothetical protein [Candidatus Diapherotrites archaeon]